MHELRARTPRRVVVLPGLRRHGTRIGVSSVQPLERECPDCGASTNRGQEYCLECGHRLPADAAAAGLPRGRLAPGGPWLALLATAAVALIAASTVSALELAGHEDGASTLIATSPQPEVLPATETVPAGESVATTAPEEAAQPPPPPATASPRAARRLIAWPRDGSGWTIVLASVPVGAGNRAVAIRQARDAVDQGLRHVGILTSSGYSSLHPGYFVVFAGVYGSYSAAAAALPRARARGYLTAYAGRVTT